LFGINHSLSRLSARVSAARGEQRPADRMYQPRPPVLCLSGGTCPIGPPRQHTVVNALAESAGARRSSDSTGETEAGT
jgi:hypothetical protein